MKTKLPFLLLLVPCAALADLAALLPSDLGLGANFSQSPFVDGDTRINADVLSRDQDGFDLAGATLAVSKTDAQQFYVGAGVDDWDYKRGDSPQLRDMHDLDRAINLRLGGAWKLPSGVVNAEVGQDVAAHKGTQAHLRYTLNSIAPAQGSLSARPYLEGQWLSSDMTDYYVGVDADEAKAGRPAYQAGDALALKAGVRLEQPLDARWTLVGDVNATGYGSEITDSPIVENSTVWGGQVGLTYKWR
ncbi:MipA/OmpV family protein [Candidatus Thiothrix sp. Deng01]|uniref:MipA/OmpV family protein n=1 Tax=Candidatus Thiothrix phosphatis TaxID=3112415 RepID=A0ABU6D0E9_9GAMM|nr:MipA/OmpV family protein [Candidatus Thiothrix sp. Deng01]MEB4592505.1 MipA/OmpV family protein [Candidatus Thiothrix sp. Deng01]